LDGTAHELKRWPLGGIQRETELGTAAMPETSDRAPDAAHGKTASCR